MSVIGFVFWWHTPWHLLFYERLGECLYVPLDRLNLADAMEREIHDYRTRLAWSLQLLRILRVTHLRVNVSWCEGTTPQGLHMLQWFLSKLSAFQVMANYNYTPQEYGTPRYTGAPTHTNSVPRMSRLSELGSFISQTAQWPHIQWIELWNEPDLETDWDQRMDPTGKRFAFMIQHAAAAARSLGKTTVLGGLCRRDYTWFIRLCQLDALREVDCIGLHNLRGTWSERTLPPTWTAQVRTLEHLTEQYTKQHKPVLITEAGYPTVDIRPQHRYSLETLNHIQAAVYADLYTQLDSLYGPAFWYTLHDLPHTVRSVRAVTTGWEDILQHHFGVLRETGEEKLLATLLRTSGPPGVVRYIRQHNLSALTHTVIDRHTPPH